MLASPAQFKIRYYVWTDEGPYRLPGQLHRDLVTGRVALNQFAGTKQKLVELVTPAGYLQNSTARGMMYQFDKKGFLDMRSMTANAMPAAHRFSSDKKISDLAPVISKRRFQAEYTWKPDKAVLGRIMSSLGDRPTKSQKIPLLKTLLKI